MISAWSDADVEMFALAFFGYGELPHETLVRLRDDPPDEFKMALGARIGQLIHRGRSLLSEHES